MKKKFLVAGVLILGLFSVLYFSTPFFTSVTYEVSPEVESAAVGSVVEDREPQIDEPPAFVVTHLPTPDPLKAIYMTSWIAGTPSLREPRIIDLLDETELNAVVIDIKDDTGKISFKVSDPFLQEFNSVENRIPGIKELIGRLHEKGIYVIGRISVFQDPYLTSIRPDLAVKRESDKSIVWTDRKGISWLDAGSKDVWDYVVAIGKEAYSVGFDELNFDYIRFPSDGNMRDIYYPLSEERILADPDLGKATVLRDFFAYLRKELDDTGAILSADLFGMTTTNPDDLNIGQILEYTAPYFDYIAPMVYPSHYPRGFNGYDDVNKYPYEIVKFSMDKGVARLLAASSTPSKLRPWLQDNDYPVPYTPDMVRAQMQATYDAGLTSWMLWNASNTYTREALLPKE